MELEDKIKNSLLIRGFSKETLLNNRGLIGATIDETILATVKNLTIPVVVKAEGSSFCLNYNEPEKECIYFKRVGNCGECYAKTK